MHSEARRSLSIMFAIMVVVFGGMAVYYFEIPLGELVILILGIIFGSMGGILVWGFRKENNGTAKTSASGLGNPYAVKNGISYYKRKNLPPIEEMIDSAKSEVGIAAVTAGGMTRLIDREYDRITKRKKLTVCIMPEDSPILEEQRKLTGSPDLSRKAHESLQNLLNGRETITNKKNLILRMHDRFLRYSIAVFDPEDENCCVRVVDYSHNPMEEWEAKIIFKKDNPDQFEKYYSEYLDIIQNHSWEIKVDNKS